MAKEKIRLTRYAKKAGWASKLGPGDLHNSLCELDLPTHPDLLVGLERSDDAGVYRLTRDLAIIQTVDFFAPIVDDPFSYGRIAAANALSDVYAMGGKPVSVLNIAGFPRKELPLEVLKSIFKGGLEIVRKAGAVLVGGHTVDDTELKYGLSVIGIVHPDRIVTNAGARPGDVLILTKPVGTGIIATALKKDSASREAEDAIVDSMTTLNRDASEVMLEIGADACTDVTGFGLLGHACEIAEGSGVGMEIDAARVPLFAEVLEYAARKMIPGGGRSNEKYYGSRIKEADGVDATLLQVLYDPQTSGGLLMAVPEDKVEAMVRSLHERGVTEAAVIGRCTVPPAIIRIKN